MEKKVITRFTAHWMPYEDDCKSEWEKICKNAVENGTEVNEVFVDKLDDNQLRAYKINYIPCLVFSSYDEKGNIFTEATVKGRFKCEELKKGFKKYLGE